MLKAFFARLSKNGRLNGKSGRVTKNNANELGPVHPSVSFSIDDVGSELDRCLLLAAMKVGKCIFFRETGLRRSGINHGR